MGKSFTCCTIDVMSLVILICNEKLLSACPTNINLNKRNFSQTWSLNWEILQSPNVPAKLGIISAIANSRSRFPINLPADADVFRTSSRRLKEMATSYDQTRCHDVWKKTSDLRRLEDIQFKTSWIRLIYDVFRTSGSRRP